MPLEMTQLTLRGLDKRLLQRIKELARQERISLNKAALRLLERGAGLSPSAPTDRIGHALDHLIGTWTPSEAKNFAEAIKGCEQIDKDLWE